MNRPDRRLWPFGPRTSLVMTPVVLVALLVVVAVFRNATGWPSADSDKLVLIGIFLISLVPVLLASIDAVAERGGVIEYRGVKLDFSRVSASTTTSISVPVNIGVPGQPITDSTTSAILHALHQAVTTDVVVIDLEDGEAWWETRLLVLLAGAVRLGRPHALVFIGTEGNVGGSFQGWATPDALLPSLVRADQRYEESYYAAKAAAQQWALVPPVAGQPALQAPPYPPWVQGLAAQYPWMAFRDGSSLPNEHAAEQFLAADLGSRVEVVNRPKGISLVRLEELFRPVLEELSIDETWPSERQLETFLDSDGAYVAVTHNGRYARLLPRTAGLNAIVKSLTQLG